MPSDFRFWDLPADWRSAIGQRADAAWTDSLVDFVHRARLKSIVHPDLADTFRAFHSTPHASVRVVILGQDPYPTPGHAHGLAFSVRPGVKIPASLRNIFKELDSDLGIPPASHGCLDSWARQGVLLLNTVLTVESGKAGSHRKKGWESFTDAAIQSLAEREKPVAFWLWGRDAQTKRPMIPDHHLVMESPHPSPLSARTGFFGSRPFSTTNEWLSRRGESAIDWQLPTNATTT
jgi:uracil-DNA glycosylase